MEDKRNPLVYLFAKNWEYSKGRRKNIVRYWAMFTASQSINLFMIPFVWKKVMDVITNQGVNDASFGTLLVLLALSFSRSPMFWSLHGCARFIERTNAFMARIDYRRHMLKGVMTMPLDWHTERHSGDVFDKLEKGATGLYSFSEESHDSIYAAVQLIGSIAVLAYFSLATMPVVLAFLCTTAWITMRVDKILIPQYRELNRAENAISESIFDAITNIGTVIILRVEGLVFKAIERKLEAPVELFRRNSRLSELKWSMTSVCCNAMIVIVVGIFFWENRGANPGILVGTTFVLIKYLDQVAELFFHFADAYSKIIQRRAKVSNAEEITQDFREENFTNHVLPPDWREIRVEELDFSYKPEEVEAAAPLHLGNVSIRFRRGDRIALVGGSGSGKTTLLSVMRDLFHPQSLKLYVDGKLVERGFEGISRAIALIPQNPEIFKSSVLENITLGAEYDIEFVRKFTDMACFTHVAERLPMKFESSIKERGVNLSGGEKQRLALARGLLACADKDIVLLDEPTASLDTDIEFEVYGNILRAFQGKTIFSSIHRLHLLPMFDWIYLFDGGRIVAEGNFDELRAKSPEFEARWQLYTRQEKVSAANRM